MEAKYLALQTIDDISILKGSSFEDFLSSVFRDLGYSVDLTPASGDYGADLILSDGRNRTVVQAKQYSKPVGFDSVKEIHFARTYYSASEAWVVSTHGFTQQAISAAKSSKIRLISGDELLSFVHLARAGGKLVGLGDDDGVIIDSDLLKASRLVVTSRNAFPGFLQEAMDISYEYALSLLKRMEDLGIIVNSSDSEKEIISDDDYVALIDEKYDPIRTKPRFSFFDYHFEVFRGSGPDSIVVVEEPTTYPSFYYFERNRSKKLGPVKWACVGEDSIRDLHDESDASKRRDRLSKLKLYDILHLTQAFSKEWNPSTMKIESKMESEECWDIARAFYQARKGEVQIFSAGFAQRCFEEEEADRERMEKEAASRREARQREAHKRMKRRTASIVFICAIILIVLIIRSILN